jgi:hypothetical protein
LDGPMTAKRVEMLKEIAPNLTRMTLMFNSRTSMGFSTELYRSHFAAAAATLKIEPKVAEVENVEQIEAGINDLADAQKGGLVLPPPTLSAFRTAS